MKNTYRFFVICLIAVILFGCNNNTESLTVNSTDYCNLRKMRAENFNKDIALTWYLDENPYKDYSCYVIEKNSELFIRNYSPDKRTHIFQGDYGYFLGVDLETYDGWVRYFPYNSSTYENGTVFIANENCKGFITKDTQSGYLLTYNHFATDGTKGYLYELVCEYTKETWVSNIIFKTEEKPLGFTYDKDGQNIYIITDSSIIAIDKDLKATVLKNTELPNTIGFNSSVIVGESIFCGSSMGVYEFRTDTREELWYPIDYEKHVK